MSYPPTSLRVQRTRRLLHVLSMLRDMRDESRSYALDNGVRCCLAEASRAVEQALDRQKQDARRELNAALAAAPVGSDARE